jgi:hypothetical protein
MHGKKEKQKDVKGYTIVEYCFTRLWFQIAYSTYDNEEGKDAKDYKWKNLQGKIFVCSTNDFILTVPMRGHLLWHEGIHNNCQSNREKHNYQAHNFTFSHCAISPK